MRTVYAAAGGTVGLERLAAAWHARVVADEVVGHAFSHGYRDDHAARLAAHWAEALGGPATFSRTLGAESTVRRMHSGNGVHDEMDRRAVACFDGALVDVGLADDERLRRTLHDWFDRMTALYAQHADDPDDVPAGLTVPHWSWDGSVD